MKSPNDPKLSDGGVRRGTCMVGGKAAAEAGAVTHGAVRCSAWLGFVRSLWMFGLYDFIPLLQAASWNLGPLLAFGRPIPNDRNA